MKPNIPAWTCDKCKKEFPTEEMVWLSVNEMVPFPYLGVDIRFTLCIDCMEEVNSFINPASSRVRYFANFDESHRDMLKEMLKTRREEICDIGRRNDDRSED